MALTISSAHPVNQPIARAVSASDMSPTQGSAAEKDQRLPSVGEVLNQRMQSHATSITGYAQDLAHGQ